MEKGSRNGACWAGALLALGLACSQGAWAGDDESAFHAEGVTRSASGKKSDKKTTTPTSGSTTTTTSRYTGNLAVVNHPGRLLASNCFQCHATDGRGGFERLAGESVNEILGEMREMRTENDEDEAIMRVHALGYTDDQVRLLADYFAHLPR